MIGATLLLLFGVMLLERWSAGRRAVDAIRERDQARMEADRLRVALGDAIRCTVLMARDHDAYVRAVAAVTAEGARSRAGASACEEAAGHHEAFRDTVDRVGQLSSLL